MGRDLRCRCRDFRRAEIELPNPPPVDTGSLRIQPHPSREGSKPLPVVKVDVLAQGKERSGPVGGARVEVDEPEAPGNGPRDRALPASRGSVYGYEYASHRRRKYSRKPRRFTVRISTPRSNRERSLSRIQGSES